MAVDPFILRLAEGISPELICVSKLTFKMVDTNKEAY